MIQVRNLTKRYGDKTAVDNISFDIEANKIYGFLGPNGAGKSTTMNMITGCLCATEGTVTVCGDDILENPIAAKQHIGYLPEIPPLYPDMTPWEYLNFVAEAKGVDAEYTYRAVNEVIDRTGLRDVADRLIANLSKGYCQRVGIAQALLGDPDIVILDEPTVGLDPKQIIEIRELIRELGETKTVILSSHILAEISAVCDHIMILAGGKLVANNTPEELENSMNTMCKLEIFVKGEEEKVEGVLNTIDGITEYTAEFFPTDGCTHITIDAEGVASLREVIFMTFAEAKLPIIYMALEHLSLEDIFLKLTTPQIDAFEENTNETELPENEDDYEDEDEEPTTYSSLFSTENNDAVKEDDEQ